MKVIGSTDEFKEFIMSDRAVVMIHKSGCPFCEKAKPWLMEFSAANPDSLVAIANKDDIPEVLEAFAVKMYPTFISFSKGRVRDVFFGDTVYNKVMDFLEKNS
ncbi:thioredoxin [Candidatus Pacearchaeota archaeon]|nr:MAG: thioredoxin [Candidatus Pacearchaeota archaeon]